MNVKSIEDITELEFLEFVKKFESGNFSTDSEVDIALDEFVRLSEHPSGTDLLYFPDPSRKHSSEDVVAQIKAWRTANGKPGFKAPSP